MKVLKKLIFIIVVVSFFDTLKIRNPNYQISASENSGVDINFGESFAVDQNIKNLKSRGILYEREIIDKVKQGRSIEYKIGTPIRVNSFLQSEYCREMGEDTIIGTVPYSTWCHKDNGPFSLVVNPNSAIILPLTIELKQGFKLNLLDTLLEGLEADYIGVIKGHSHNPNKLTGSNFKFGQDRLLGIVDHKQKLMLLYEISDLGIYRNKRSNNLSLKNSSHDLLINLINKNGQVNGGITFGENKKHCFNHSKNCLFKNIHLIEYHYKSDAPQITLDKNWGYITGETSPPYTLLEDYGSLQKIFLSRNYYLLIDLNENQSRNISRIEVSNKIIE